MTAGPGDGTLNRRIVNAVLLLLCAPVLYGASAWSQDAGKPPAPEIVDLGNQQYRIGEITVDKAAGLFRVSGQVLRDQPPLEFLVVVKGGYKAYESVLEVDANAFEFNLACILIGLDGSHAKPPDKRVFDQPLEGDAVEVTVSWLEGDKSMQANASEFLTFGDPPKVISSRDWVYTGSQMLEDGRYFADITGVLVGFVHRVESIIDHKQGIGLGMYGSVNVNRELVPGVGTPVILTVRRVRSER